MKAISEVRVYIVGMDFAYVKGVMVCLNCAMVFSKYVV